MIALIFLTRWRLITIYLLVILGVVAILIVVFFFIKTANSANFGRKMQLFYRYLLGYSAVEKKYIDYIHSIEQGKRTKKEIQDVFRKKVTDDPNIRFPEFGSEKVLKDFRKMINNR